MAEEKAEIALEADKDVLLGVVLDLSGSMSTSIKNSRHGQLSRIESILQAFHEIIDDWNILLQEMVEDKIQALRMFIYGFGVQSENSPTLTSGIGDVFSILTNLEIIKR